MDAKIILKSPRDFLESSNMSAGDSVETSLFFLKEEFDKTKAELKKLNDQKRNISSQFKHNKSDLVALSELKAGMQSVSVAINHLSEQQKEILRKTNTIAIQHSAPEAKQLPGQFSPLDAPLNKPLTFKLQTDDKSNEWNDFTTRLKSRASIYHSVEIACAIKEAFKHETIVLLAFADDNVVGGLPLTLTDSKIFGNNATSVPFFNYGGPLTQYQDVATALISESSKLMNTHNVDQVEIRTTLEGLPFPCSTKKVSMVLTLPPTAEKLSEQLGAKVRSQIKRSVEHKPRALFGKLELLDDFYAVFAKNMRDLGTPVYSKTWFRQLLSDPKINAVIVVCYIRKQPVSSAFLLGNGDMLEIPWASTLKKANAQNMNMWMYDQILKFAISEKYGFFDFGRSSKNAGTYRFKKQWGAKPIQHYWYYPGSKLETFGGANPDNPKFRMLIWCWRRLPVWLTKVIGPPIVKNIP